MIVIDITSTCHVNVGFNGSTAVLFIPENREHEYQFSTLEGLRAIGKQANYRRLISVRCNKPHVFKDTSDIQNEINAIILSLAPICFDKDKEQIPYMTLQNDDKKWEIIDSGISLQSGDFIIEEAIWDDIKDDYDDHVQISRHYNGNFTAIVVRRLKFLENQNFIQTEVRLLPVALKSLDNSSKSKSNKSGNKSNIKLKTGIVETANSLYKFDYSYIDKHHAAALVSFILYPDLIHQYSNMTSSYKSTSNTGETKGIIVGLGGGAFPMIFQKYLPNISFTFCYIDEMLPVLAK